jgi:hypothetical protein
VVLKAPIEQRRSERALEILARGKGRFRARLRPSGHLERIGAGLDRGEVALRRWIESAKDDHRPLMKDR